MVFFLILFVCGPEADEDAQAVKNMVEELKKIGDDVERRAGSLVAEASKAIQVEALKAAGHIDLKIYLTAIGNISAAVLEQTSGKDPQTVSTNLCVRYAGAMNMNEY